MARRERITTGVAAAAWLLAACAGTTSHSAEPSGSPAAPPASTVGATPAPAGQPVAAPASVPMGQAQPATPGSGPAAPPSGMLPAPAAPTTPGAMPATAEPALKVTARGSCPPPHRKASYHTPCGAEENPDPCGIHSGFDGDEYCWPAPAEGEGVQMHIGPSNYDDPAEVQKWIVEPGFETLEYIGGVNPLTENKWSNHIQVRMRPGSHHWIISLVSGTITPGFYGQTQGCGSSSVGGIGGGQSLILDNPPQGVPAPEDEGYASEIPGNSSICANVHHYNLEDHPVLMEVWMNVYFSDPPSSTKRGERIGMIGAQGISLAPGRMQEYSYSARFGADGRIRSLFGHRHMYTDRFAVWVNEDLIYDSWDWRESVTFLYDSITENPPINTEGMVDGAVSGIVNIKSGDTLKYSCFVRNTSDVTLTFRNDVDTGEMCNLFGGTVGEGTGLQANNL